MIDRFCGVVVDTSSGTPLEGVLVTVVELGRKGLSDSRGQFEFPDMPQGNFTL